MEAKKGGIAGVPLPPKMFAASSRNVHSWEEADIDMVMLEDELDDDLSAAENAIKLLKGMVESGRLCQHDAASCRYAINSFKLGEGMQHIPHGLLVPKSQDDAEVSELIRQEYTPMSRAGVARRDHLTLKSAVNGIIFAMRLTNSATGNTRRRGSTDSNAELLTLPFTTTNARLKEISRALFTVDDWTSFDIFRLQEVSEDRCLQVLAWHLLHKWDLVRIFAMEDEVLKNFVEFVAEGYSRDNPYHNRTHAADVLQSAHYMLSSGGLGEYLSDVEKLSFLVAAMVHDFGHDGLSNNFHKNAMTDRSVRFNDQSIQENYHLYTFFKKLLADPSINIFDGMGPKQFASLRSTVIALLLQTDMSKHFTLQDSFKNLLEKHGKDPGNWGEDTQMLMGMVLHAVDIGAQAKSNAIALKWCALAHDEFFAQGDLERTKQMPISQCCDRDTTQINASQVGFISFIVKPTFVTIGRLFPNVEETCVPLCEANKQYYQSQVTPAASPRSPVGKLQSPKVAPMNPRLPAASLGASAMSESKKMKLGSELSIAEDGPPAPGREGRKL
eukprot:CAMPEP_0173420446 /NCGR_PEP_ID=MMETSP1357-20121228/1927_1 /TAXON_ID=77926 /ORGANISM="Hemiselmis rufescens, Strain PCC563" /LENGTH=555 /DNA_ID=CAMNT_0014383233 /DNA_START=251 /DNA_END=1915 /DNA_ORIENTATION=-